MSNFRLEGVQQNIENQAPLGNEGNAATSRTGVVDSPLLDGVVWENAVTFLARVEQSGEQDFRDVSPFSSLAAASPTTVGVISPAMFDQFIDQASDLAQRANLLSHPTNAQYQSGLNTIFFNFGAKLETFVRLLSDCRRRSFGGESAVDVAVASAAKMRLSVGSEQQRSTEQFKAQVDQLMMRAKAAVRDREVEQNIAELEALSAELAMQSWLLERAPAPRTDINVHGVPQINLFPDA